MTTIPLDALPLRERQASDIGNQRSSSESHDRRLSVLGLGARVRGGNPRWFGLLMARSPFVPA